MTESTETLDVFADVSSHCASTIAVPGAGTELLEILHRAIPYEAAALSMWNPSTASHHTVSTIDYPSAVLDYLNTGFTTDDPAFLAMRYRNQQPMRWCDIPHYAESFSAREVFIPGGFHEGVTSCLFTPDGRYAGAMHLSTDLPLPVSDASVHILSAIRKVIATYVDALRPGAGEGGASTLLDGHVAAAVSTADGLHPVSYDGRTTTSIEPLSRYLREINACLRVGGPRSFYVVSEDEQTLRIQVLPNRIGAMVVAHRAHLPHDLTRRELQVLGLIVHGHSNAAIGSVLHLSRSTVSTHVEHLLGKLQCASRAAASAIAVAEGLCAPPDVPTQAQPNVSGRSRPMVRVLFDDRGPNGPTAVHEQVLSHDVVGER